MEDEAPSQRESDSQSKMLLARVAELERNQVGVRKDQPSTTSGDVTAALYEDAKKMAVSKAAKSREKFEASCYNTWRTKRQPRLPSELLHSAYGLAIDILNGHTKPEDDSPSEELLQQILKTIKELYEVADADVKLEHSHNWQDFLNLLLDLGNRGTVRQVETINSNKADLCLLLEKIPILVMELKKDVNSATAHPDLQAMLYALQLCEKLPRDRRYCVLLISAVGPNVGLYSLSVDGGSDMQPLIPAAPYMYYGKGVASHVFNYLSAIKAAVNELLKTCLISGYLKEQKMPVPYPILGWDVKEQLFSGNPSNFVFLAVPPGEKSPVVVKFAESYGLEVHRPWAGASLAPRLKDNYCRVLPGNYQMVVMDYLSPEEGWKVLSPPLNDKQSAAVRDGLVKVHALEPKSAHGDLRAPNISYRSDKEGTVEVKFLDYDWACVDGDGSYPLFMNQDYVSWPAGAAAGKPVWQQHDVDLTQRLIRQVAGGKRSRSTAQSA